MKDKKIFARLGDSVTGPSDLLGNREPSKLFYPMTACFARLLSCVPEKMVSKRSLACRRLLHSAFVRLSPLLLEHRQVIESKNALLGIDAPDAPLELPQEPVIWCGNHRFKDDVLATVLAATRHAYILFGSLPMFFNTLDGIGAYINGVVMCNRKVKKSRAVSHEVAGQVLKMGTDLLIFPEGVWNKTPDKLLLDFWPGAYHLAKDTGSKIVPIVHYLAEPHGRSEEHVIHTVVADPISMEGLTEAEGMRLLRDTMATWYFRLMERYGRSTRSELLGDALTAQEAWEQYIAMHTGAVPFYDREIELAADYRPRSIMRPEDVWRPVAEIQTVTAANAAHVAFANHLVLREHQRDFQRRY